MDDPEPTGPIETTNHCIPPTADANDAVVRRSVGPHHQGGQRRGREDLDRGGQLDRDVERNRDPDRGLAETGHEEADRDEQLGEDDRLRRQLLESGVEQQLDERVGHAGIGHTVLVAFDPKAGHGPTPPVRVDQLAEAAGEVDERYREPQDGQREPAGPEWAERRSPPTGTERVDRDGPAGRQHRQADEQDQEEGTVVMEVRLGEEEVVGDSGDGQPGHQPGPQADRQQQRGEGRPPEHGHVHPFGKLRVPRPVRECEGVRVDHTVERVGEERPEMEEHERPDGQSQDGE